MGAPSVIPKAGIASNDYWPCNGGDWKTFGRHLKKATIAASLTSMSCQRFASSPPRIRDWFTKHCWICASTKRSMACGSIISMDYLTLRLTYSHFCQGCPKTVSRILSWKKSSVPARPYHPTGPQPAPLATTFSMPAWRFPRPQRLGAPAYDLWAVASGQ